MQQEYLDKERALEERLRDLRTNLAQLEQSRKMKEKTVQENRRKMADISRELASLGSGGSAIEGLEQDLRSAVSGITHAHRHMHTGTHAHMHTCTQAHLHTCTQAHRHTCTHAHKYSLFTNIVYMMNCGTTLPRLTLF